MLAAGLKLTGLFSVRVSVKCWKLLSPKMIRASLGAILKPKVHSVSTISRAWQAQPSSALGAFRWYSEKPVEPTITFEELRERVKTENPDSVCPTCLRIMLHVRLVTND